MTDYIKKTWINGAAPPLSAANIQTIDDGVDTAHSELQDHLDDISDAHAGTAITNTPAGNIAATTAQLAINELDTEKVAKAGDTMSGTLVIDPATDVPALQIIPASDTAATKFMIQGRNAANDADKFTIDNAGNIVTVGTVDGADISAHAHTGADGTVVVNAATVTIVDSTSATTWPVIVDTVTGSLAAKTDAGLTYNAETANLATTTFTGALAGNAATATLAATVTVVESTDASSSILMTDSATGSLAVKSDTGLTYNAETAALTATTFVGALTGNASGSSGSCTGNAATATLATTSTVIDSTSATTWPTIVDTATGSLAIKTDAGLTYNAETANLATTTFTGALAGNATTSTNTTGNAATVTVADAASATTTYPLLGTAVSGSLSPKTDTGLTYNADTNALTATTFVGAVTGASSLNVLKTGDTMGGNLIFSNAQKIIGGTATTADLTLQTTTGVGEAGADMHFLVGNNGATEAITILNSGNVGIGTVVPELPLEIQSSANNGQIQIRNNDDGGKTKWRIGSLAAFDYGFNLGTDGLNGIIFAKSTGNVGIGTTAPTHILSLGNAQAQKFWIENTATDVVGRALTIASGGTIAGTAVDDVVGGNLIVQAGLGTGTGASTISFQNGTTLTTGKTLQTMETKMTILGNGNVGIGQIPSGASILELLLTGVPAAANNTAAAAAGVVVGGLYRTDADPSILAIRTA